MLSAVSTAGIVTVESKASIDWPYNALRFAVVNSFYLEIPVGATSLWNLSTMLSLPKSTTCAMERDTDGEMHTAHSSVSICTATHHCCGSIVRSFIYHEEQSHPESASDFSKSTSETEDLCYPFNPRRLNLIDMPLLV